MTGWTRTPLQRVCGRCAGHIDRGAPIYVMELARLSHTKIRCESCAGPAPDDLPPFTELPRPTPSAPLSFARFSVSALPFDYKQAQAGRDPGEEG